MKDTGHTDTRLVKLCIILTTSQYSTAVFTVTKYKVILRFIFFLEGRLTSCMDNAVLSNIKVTICKWHTNICEPSNS